MEYVAIGVALFSICSSASTGSCGCGCGCSICCRAFLDCRITLSELSLFEKAFFVLHVLGFPLEATASVTVGPALIGGPELNSVGEGDGLGEYD
jgi:hypothetical protein